MEAGKAEIASKRQTTVKPNRILVRGVNWLGDSVMTTPALLRHTGRAVVFTSLADMAERLDDPDLDVTADALNMTADGHLVVIAKAAVILLTPGTGVLTPGWPRPHHQ